MGSHAGLVGLQVEIQIDRIDPPRGRGAVKTAKAYGQAVTHASSEFKSIVEWRL